MKRGSTYLGLLLGFCMAGLFSARPARAMNAGEYAPEQQAPAAVESFAYPQSLHYPSFSGEGRDADYTMKDGPMKLSLSLKQQKGDRYGLTFTSGVQRVIDGSLSLGSDGEFTAKAEFMEDRHEPTMAEMLKSKLGLAPARANPAEGPGQGNSRLANIALGLRYGSGSLKYRQAGESRSLSASYGENFALDMSEEGETRAVGSRYGPLSLRAVRSPNQRSDEIGYEKGDCSLNLLMSDNQRRLIAKKGNLSLSHVQAGGGRSTTDLNLGPYHLFLGPGERRYQYAGQGLKFKVTDRPEGTDIDFERGRWGFERTAAGSLMEYRMGRNIALAFGNRKGSAGLDRTSWSGDLGRLSVGGYDLGQASMELGIAGNRFQNIGFNIGNAEGPFHLGYGLRGGRDSVSLRLKDPKSGNYELFLDKSGKEITAWGTARREF